jgi:dolichyl-phosphate-mannose-protein mannosyltransferase
MRRGPGLFPLVLALALAVRLPWLPAEGYAGDVLMYAGWGAYVADHGLGPAYATQDFTHGPVWPALAGGVSWLWTRVAGWAGVPARPVPHPLIKLPPLIADLLIGWLIYRAARARRSPAASATLAALYLFNPGVVLDSAWWGQTDALAALWVVAGVLALAAGRPAAASTSVALALLTKLQTYFLAPLTVVVLARRGDGKALMRAAGAALVALLAGCAPLIVAGTIHDLLARYAQLVGRHPTVHVNAFNLWWLGHGWSGNRLPDETLLVGPWSFRQIGLFLVIAYTVAVLAWLWRHSDAEVIPLAAACLALAFFMLPTQIHSRYMYPVLPLLLVASLTRPRLLIAYGVLSVTFLLNQVHLILRASGPPPAWLDATEAMGLSTTLLAWTNLATFLAMTSLLLRPRAQLGSGLARGTPARGRPAPAGREVA